MSNNRSLARNPIANAQREAFVRKHLKLILETSIDGWPHITTNPQYGIWLALVDSARTQGVWSRKTSVCDTVMQLRRKAEKLQPKPHPAT